MAKLVYKGKINRNNVVYKEGCFHGCFDRMEGQFLQNIMEVVTENGKKFRFRDYDCNCTFIKRLLTEDKDYHPDFLSEVIIEEGKKKLSYNARSMNINTVKGMRTISIFEKANALYNDIRQEIMEELKGQYPVKKPKPKPKPKKLEQRVISPEEKDLILEEVNEIFDTGAIDLCFYKGDAKKFIRFFSKIEDKSKRKELLNVIFNCSYENKEVIEWLNKNEHDLLREAGFNE